MKQCEITYNKRLCKDYNLLTSFLESGFYLFCFIDDDLNGKKYRKQSVIKPDFNLVDNYLAFLDEKPENEKKQLFITYCQKVNLTYILP